RPRMYHTGIDLRGTDEQTPVLAAQAGTVKLVIGLAPKYGAPFGPCAGSGGGNERMRFWIDTDKDEAVDPGELTSRTNPQCTGRTEDNHGLGMVIVIEHSANLYTLYGHLSAVKKEVWDAIRVGDTYPVEQGDPIGVVGHSHYNTFDGAFVPHVHFEVKERETVQSPWNDGGSYYTGYTPDLPGPYGYQDPLLSIYPPPNFSPIKVAIKVINEEGGSSELKRGVRVYSGPGVNYGVLGWTGLDQMFVANATAVSTMPGDSMVNRLWYRISLPNRLGPSHGWVASRKSDGTVLIQEDASAIIIEVTGAGNVGWRLSRNPGIDCGTIPSNCVRVWDNLAKRYRNVLAWDGSQFVRFTTQTVSGATWHGVYVPKIYHNDPQGTDKVASPSGRYPFLKTPIL
ncbi:MAG: M23 family metallopeptidase, partial [Patescibacteria group bacterium]